MVCVMNLNLILSWLQTQPIFVNVFTSSQLDIHLTNQLRSQKDSCNLRSFSYEIRLVRNYNAYLGNFKIFVMDSVNRAEIIYIYIYKIIYELIILIKSLLVFIFRNFIILNIYSEKYFQWTILLFDDLGRGKSKFDQWGKEIFLPN